MGSCARTVKSPFAPGATAGAPESPPAEPEVAQDPLEAARAEVQRVRDQLLRTAADFDNFRKRSRKETQEAERRAKEDFLRDLLPVFDNLERAAQHAETATDVKSLSEGVAMVVRLFIDTLGRLGVERVCMRRHQITDIRELYRNDVRFLHQF